MGSERSEGTVQWSPAEHKRLIVVPDTVLVVYVVKIGDRKTVYRAH